MGCWWLYVGLSLSYEVHMPLYYIMPRSPFRGKLHDRERAVSVDCGGGDVVVTNLGDESLVFSCSPSRSKNSFTSTELSISQKCCFAE